MEESRCKSRVVINDQVYDQIQQQRYKKHMQTLQKLRSFQKKSNSHYLITPYPTVSLDKSKRAQRQVFRKVFPPDIEFKNCARRIQDIQNSYTKLPKISTIKLYQNKTLKQQQKKRIDKQNKILLTKIAHLSLEKGKKRADAIKSMHEYELYKKISRRNKSIAQMIANEKS